MDVLIGLAIYFTIGLVLAKVFVVYSKTAYDNFSSVYIPNDNFIRCYGMFRFID